MDNPEHTHLCDTCLHEFATCPGKAKVFGIDVDPSARDEAADTVLQCDAYTAKDGAK